MARAPRPQRNVIKTVRAGPRPHAKPSREPRTPADTTEPEAVAPEAPRAFLDAWWESYLVVGLTAAVVQFVQIKMLAGDPTVIGPIIDGREFHAEAVRIATHAPAPPVPHWQSPVFTWALGAVYQLLDTEPATGLVLQALCAVGIALTLLSIARTLTTPRAALGAGIAAALYGPLLFFSSQLIAAPLDALTALVTLRLALWATPDRAPWAHALTGLSLGVAVASRGTVAPFGLFLAWQVWRARGDLGARGAALRTVALVAGVVLGMLPVAVSNEARAGVFSFVTTNGGLNLYVGTNWNIAATTGLRPGWQWDDLLAEPARHGVTEPFAMSAYFRDRALSWAAHHPFAFAKALVEKFVDVFQGAEIARNLDPYGTLGRTPLTRVMLWSAGLRFPFGVVFPLGVFGAFTLRERARTVVAFVLLNALGIALFFPSGRYRLGLALALLPLAAAGVAAVVERVEVPRRAWVGAALALVLTNVLPAFTGPDLRHETALQTAWAYMSANRPADAARVLEPATQQRDDADQWRSLAEARDRLGDRAGAITALERAVTLAPRHAHALQHLGALLARTGRSRESIPYLERCVRLNPEHPIAWSDLAASYVDVGDWAGARRAATEARRLNPADGYAMFYQGAAMQHLGDLDGAEPVLHEAVLRLNGVPDARVALAETLHGLRRDVEATTVLRNLLRRWPRHPRARALLQELDPAAPELTQPARRPTAP